MESRTQRSFPIPFQQGRAGGGMSGFHSFLCVRPAAATAPETAGRRGAYGKAPLLCVNFCGLAHTIREIAAVQPA